MLRYSRTSLASQLDEAPSSSMAQSKHLTRIRSLESIVNGTLMARAVTSVGSFLQSSPSMMADASKPEAPMSQSLEVSSLATPIPEVISSARTPFNSQTTPVHLANIRSTGFGNGHICSRTAMSRRTSRTPHVSISTSSHRRLPTREHSTLRALREQQSIVSQWRPSSQPHS